MKNIRCTLAVLIIMVPVLMGMSPSPGQGSPEKIPIPAKKFSATFVDQMDTVTDCTEASIEGGTFLEGKRGEGLNTISFDLIDTILFTKNADKTLAVVKLRDGNTVELVVKKDQKAYGYTRYGTFQIRLSELKNVIISKGSPIKN